MAFRGAIRCPGRVALHASVWATLGLLAGTGPLSPAPVAAQGQEPRTALEESGFERHTSHPEMSAYLRELGAVAHDMSLSTYGTTHQGRDLYLAAFSRPAVRTPAEAHATGKPIVLLGANVHGYNYTLRESLLIMMRELGTRGTELNDLLDEVIVLVAPSKNPDGLEAGTRFNAVGADLNRDYMALEHPAMAAYVGNVINHWHPHLYVDGHDGGAVQYGGAYPYSLLYQASAIAGADPSLTEIADREIFPLIDRNYEAEGFEAFYWARGDRDRWYGGGSAPRMGRNYGGLANKVTILFELAEWHETPVAVETGILAYRSILQYARDHGERLVSTVEEARRRTVALGERAEGRIPVDETMEPDDFRVTYRIPDPDRSDALVTVEDAEIVKKPVGTRFRDRPYAYLLPPGADDAVALLRRHGIAVERLTRAVELPVQAYTLAGVRYENTDLGHRAAVRVEVGSVREKDLELSWGWYVVRTGQVLGRVAAHLLEPETSDGVVYWNRMSALLPKADLAAHRADPANHPEPTIPIYKLMERRPLPTTSVR
jgi:dipeptidyl-peptidase 4